MKRILILVPHPDDEVVGLCCFIKRQISLGSKVFLFILTNGVIQKDKMWVWQRKNFDYILKSRNLELKKSLKNLDISKFYKQNIPTRKLRFFLTKTYRKIDQIIQKEKISDLFTPAFEGGHQDHDLANFLASKFIKKTNVFEFSEYNFSNFKVKSNKFIEEFGNEVTIELNSKERKFKKKAMEIYLSEKNNLNYINLNRETYRPLPLYDYFSSPHKGILFYKRFSFFSWHPKVDGTNLNEIKKKMLEFDDSFSK